MSKQKISVGCSTIYREENFLPGYKIRFPPRNLGMSASQFLL